MDAQVIKTIMMGATIVLGGGMPALAIGMITWKSVESIGRNPEAAGDVRTTMILGAAFAEAIAIYALVCALIIKFV
jgi:F-type H+-transporting ATPase subunit c